MSIGAPDVRPRRARGRPAGSRNKISQDLREDIVASFYKLGGRDWLVRVGRQRPDVVIGLLAKVIPQETRVSLMASYQAMPIPVEARDALPAIAQESRGDVLTAVYDVIDPDAAPVPAAQPSEPDTGDWL